ncbi:MAG: acetylglutamate kinase [Chloroflexia bacterium]
MQRLVIKLGGEIMLNAPGLDAICADVAALAREGTEVVLVHGGGPQADALADRLGHAVRKVQGRRVTDDDALEVAKMVYAGSINVNLLAALKRHGALGVGVSGVDGNLIEVTRRPPKPVRDPSTGAEEWVDFGHVGDVQSVDASLLELLLHEGYVPVVASLAADSEGHVYNVNADTIATSLAVALSAARLYLVTNVPGILRNPADPTSIVPVCNLQELETLVRDGIITGGMLPKVHNCIEAIQAGVPIVQIVDGTGERSPIAESLSNEGIGTRISS